MPLKRYLGQLAPQAYQRVELEKLEDVVRFPQLAVAFVGKSRLGILEVGHFLFG
jgi:hypothetical protein